MMGRENKMGRSFRYSIVEDEDEQVLGYFDDVAGLSGGFFVEVEGRQYNQIEIIDCYPLGRLESWFWGPRTVRQARLGNVRLAILNQSQEVIGSYYLASAILLKSSRSEDDVRLGNIVTAALLPAPAHPDALRLWDTWRVQAPVKNGLWVPLLPEERAAWLEIVRLYDANRRKVTRIPSMEVVIELDGTNITDHPGFFCAIGEAINGPGGYFGADLDGLNDCLRGDFGIVPPFTLRWLNPEVARQSLTSLGPPNSQWPSTRLSEGEPDSDLLIRSSAEEFSLFERIVNVFRENQVTINFV
jgi:RNAse (barnase) inhibitor barstar